MKPKKIYIVRHGQTDYNLQGIMQGRKINASLNETGRKQAQSFWNAFKDIPFQKIYTSALKRTSESVQNFIDLKIPHVQREGLDEISWGSYDGKKIMHDAHYLEAMKEWANGNTSIKIGGGESPEDVRDRQAPVLKEIQDSDEDLILICMHGRAMRILLSNFVDNDLRNMDSFEHKNLGLYVVEMTENGLTILERNVIDHLD